MIKTVIIPTAKRKRALLTVLSIIYFSKAINIQIKINSYSLKFRFDLSSIFIELINNRAVSIKVFKFGGASVKDVSGFRNVVDIIKESSFYKLLIVVSATGKTTNALQQVVRDHYSSENDAFKTLAKVKESHINMISELVPDNKTIQDEILDTFVEIDWMLEEEAHENYDFEYDQIVSVGELVSSKMLNASLKEAGLKSEWLDVRDVLLTDNTYREAKVQWEETEKKIKAKTDQIFENNDIIVTQGFIGASSENFTTTLGREGSDFSASIFSYSLNASGMYIWKDVPGVLTGDPRLFENVTKLENLSYREAVEMTYYGAKVIHPKTIKPIQNKAIPLYVKSFKDPQSDGTKIGDVEDATYPPIVVFEHNQCLLRISTRDFSFVAEDHLKEIFELIARHRIKIKMMKNTAISFLISVDDDSERISNFLKALEENFNYTQEKNLELLTIRHYNMEIIKSMTSERIILFEEKLPNTIQMVVKPIPTMRIKE